MKTPPTNPTLLLTLLLALGLCSGCRKKDGREPATTKHPEAVSCLKKNIPTRGSLSCSANETLTGITQLEGLREIYVFGPNNDRLRELSGPCRYRALVLANASEVRLDLSLLAAPCVKRMELSFVRIVNVGSLGSLKALRELTLLQSTVEGPGQLSKLRQVTDLSWRDSKLSDASAIAGLSGIVRLHLDWPKLQRLVFVTTMKRLESLRLSSARQLKFEDLAGSQIRTLWLVSTNAPPLRVLQSLPRLTRLVLQRISIPPTAVAQMRSALPKVHIVLVP